MIDCPILIGDSIAVGISQTMHCPSVAQISVPSFFLYSIKQIPSEDTVIISIGSNDGANPKLGRNINDFRERLKGKKVIWIIPYHMDAAIHVQQVAANFHDVVLDLSSFSTKDGVHPWSYGKVTSTLIKLIGGK